LLLDRYRPEAPRILTVTLGSARLTFPSTLLRSPSAAPSIAAAQAVGRLDLALTWPQLDPMDPRLLAEGPGWASPAREGGPDLVQVSLAAADDSPHPETRVQSLYARFLDSQVVSGPGELLTRRFRADSPYAGEVLVFSPPDGKRLAARCEGEPVAAVPAEPARASRPRLPPLCIAEFRRHGLDIQLRFEAGLSGGLDVAQRRLAALLDGMAR
jgi:hypothetical protein